MSMIEANIFAIENLDALKTDYVLYQIRGLTRGDNEYFQNKDEITGKLSYDLRMPALVIERNGHPHLVLPADAPDPPQSLSLVRAQVYFDKLEESLTLDYSKRTPETDDICLSFLNFFAIKAGFGVISAYGYLGPASSSLSINRSKPQGDSTSSRASLLGRSSRPTMGLAFASTCARSLSRASPLTPS